MNTLSSLALALLAISPLLAFFSLFTWLRRSAKKIEPKQDGPALIFHLAPKMRLLLRLVSLALVLFMVLVFVATRSEGASPIAVLIPLILFLAILLAKPEPITLDHYGLHQTRWIGRDREIPWNEVESLSLGRNTGTIYVTSRKGGGHIPFSALLVGRLRFVQEVRARAHRCHEIEVE